MYSSCLHDQQDLCWGNTSRDTSEESQESQGGNFDFLAIKMALRQEMAFSYLKGS